MISGITLVGARWPASGGELVGGVAIRIFLLSLRTLLFLLPQNRADTVNISGQYRQRNIALEAADSMVWAHVQAMDFQRIDRRFNR